MDSVPTLNFDMISNILNIRMNQKRKDRIEAHKKNMDNIVNSIKNFDTVRNGKSDYIVEYPNDYQHTSTTRLQEIPQFHNGVYMLELIEDENQTVQRPYMPWEKEWY